MTQFGQPVRSATSDAKEGIINPPAKRVATRSTAIQLQPEQTSGVSSFANAIGRVAQEALNEQTANVNERRAIEAAARQGTAKGINDVDATKKRTGFNKFIFGENVEYREAQKRAVANGVTDLYLQAASEIDTHAGSTPEEYQAVLAENLDSMLENYDDKETRALVTQGWATASSKLSKKHYENHYAYNQQQQRETVRKSIRSSADIFTKDESLATTQEEQQGVELAKNALFNRSMKPEKMSDTAWDSLMKEEINNSLREGNIGLYKAAKSRGVLDELSLDEQVALERSIENYDTAYGQEAMLLYEQAELQAETVNTLEGAKLSWLDMNAKLDQLESRSTGTDKANLAIARQRTGAQKDINAREKASDNIALKSIREAKKKEDAAARMDSIKQALLLDPVSRTTALKDLGYPKKSELEEAMDSNVISLISDLSQSKDLLSSKEAMAELLDNRGIQEAVVRRIKESKVEVPLVKTLAENYINGWSTLVDEDGQPTEKSLQAMGLLSMLERDANKFKSTIGADNYDNWLILKRGVQVGKTEDMIRKETEALSTYKQDKDLRLDRYPTKTGESKQDYVKRIVGRIPNYNPSGNELNDLLVDFQKGLIINNGNFTLAENYIIDSVKGGSIEYKGNPIWGGKHLDELTPDHRFEQIMDGSEELNLMVGYLSLGTGGKKDDLGNPKFRRLSDLSDFTINVPINGDGIVIDSTNFQAPVRISEETLRTWDRQLTQHEKFEKMREQIQAEQVLNDWKTNPNAFKAL